MQPNKLTRISWQNQPMPSRRSPLPVQRVYSPDEYAKIARGYLPETMEDKWFIFLEHDRLHCCRSWTGICIYEVQFTQQKGQYAIAEAWVNRDPEQYTETDDKHDANLLLYLIDSLLLGYDVECPDRPDLNPDQNDLYARSKVGRVLEHTQQQDDATVNTMQGHPIIVAFGNTAAADYPLILVIGREPNSDHEVVNIVGTYDFRNAPRCGFWNSSYSLAARSVDLAPGEFKQACIQRNGSPILYADAMPQGLLNSNPDKHHKRKAISEEAIRQHIENMFSHDILDLVRLVILSGLDARVFGLSRELILKKCGERGIAAVSLPFFSGYNAKRIKQAVDQSIHAQVASVVAAFLRVARTAQPARLNAERE